MTPLFCQAEFHQVVAGQQNALRDEVERFSEDYLPGVSEEKLTEDLLDKYSIEPPVIGEPYIDSDQEVKFDVRNDWRRAISDKSKPFYVPGHRIEIRLPFAGHAQIFNIAPSSRSWNPPEVHEIEADYLSFVFEGVDLQSEQI